MAVKKIIEAEYLTNRQKILIDLANYRILEGFRISHEGGKEGEHLWKKYFSDAAKTLTNLAIISRYNPEVKNQALDAARRLRRIAKDKDGKRTEYLKRLGRL